MATFLFTLKMEKSRVVEQYKSFVFYNTEKKYSGTVYDTGLNTVIIKCIS